MVAPVPFRSEASFPQREFRRWIDTRPAWDISHYELLNGHIVMSPPAGWTHSRVGARLVRFLEEHVSKRQLGFVFDASAGYDLPSGDTVEPDVSYVASGRLRVRPPMRPDQFLKVAPNLVVEILSPTTAKRDLTEKKAIYERNGVEEYWIVDAVQETVTVFRLGDRGYEAGRKVDRGTIRSRVLPRLRLAVFKLFAS